MKGRMFWLYEVSFQLFIIKYESVMGQTFQICPGLEKVSFRSYPKEGECQRIFNTVAVVSHASKVMLKILQARLQ